MGDYRRKFKVGQTVEFNESCGTDIMGELAGEVVGYYEDYLPIVAVATVRSDGDRAAVFHEALLTSRS